MKTIGHQASDEITLLYKHGWRNREGVVVGSQQLRFSLSTSKECNFSPHICVLKINSCPQFLVSFATTINNFTKYSYNSYCMTIRIEEVRYFNVKRRMLKGYVILLNGL